MESKEKPNYAIDSQGRHHEILQVRDWDLTHWNEDSSTEGFTTVIRKKTFKKKEPNGHGTMVRNVRTKGDRLIMRADARNKRINRHLQNRHGQSMEFTKGKRFEKPSANNTIDPIGDARHDLDLNRVKSGRSITLHGRQAALKSNEPLLPTKPPPSNSRSGQLSHVHPGHVHALRKRRTECGRRLTDVGFKSRRINGSITQKLQPPVPVRDAGKEAIKDLTHDSKDKIPGKSHIGKRRLRRMGLRIMDPSLNRRTIGTLERRLIQGITKRHMP